MKKIKNEAGLLKEAIRVGSKYFEARGAGKFEASDHVDLRVRAIYTLLVKDKQIQPLASQDENLQGMRHKLALWIARQLPENHSLLQ